ncbi:hypothetical protein CEXT_776941 [Caerostris extrusa]|uniref:Uncharacterized protein n=1 Tax=Caerostris extrusa TaxID=172846 RepID=A0AAV4SMQ6_CAEEX|nr:hypothetical protein CEXT_776941 [Caerostris extrusa]
MSCSEQNSICCENCYGVFGVADMRNLPPSVGAHKSSHRWRWEPNSGAKSRGFNIRMGLMGREAIMSCSQQDSICRENCYGLFGVATSGNLVNVSLNVFLAKEWSNLFGYLLALYLNERY